MDRDFYLHIRRSAMEEKIELSDGKKVTIREINFIEFSSLEGNLSKSEAIKQTLKLGTDLTDEDIKSLTTRDGLKITQKINSLNGFDTNFQQA